MSHDPDIPAYYTSDKKSFAYTTAKDRWPVIVTGTLDDVHRTIANSNDAEAIREGKAIVETIAKLKYEVQHDRALTPLLDDGQPDIESYNAELAILKSPTWFNIPWLYGECYLYRRLNTLFSMTQHWKSYDVFSRQKLSTFRSSKTAVIELIARYKDLVKTLQAGTAAGTSEEVEKADALLFEEMCEICLWGNATDLSLLTSLTYDDIQKLQGSEARKSSKSNILVDDSPAAFKILRDARSSKATTDRRVDIVLDNAGFELFVDLILAAYLLSADYATHVVLHPKSIPWFVSDVLPADFAALLNTLADPQKFFSESSGDETQASAPMTEQEVEDVRFFFQSLCEFHGNGQLVIRPNRFWTYSGGFWRLPATDHALYEDLCSSELVIFKGDLNYRKLVGDVMWDPATPFTTAIGPLGKHSGMRTLALRTCKADVVVGLSQGEDERLRQMDGGGGDSGTRKWAWSGKWAVMQFCDGKA